MAKQGTTSFSLWETENARIARVAKEEKRLEAKKIGKWYVHTESTPRCKSGCGSDCYSVVRDDAESNATIATEIQSLDDANLIAGAEQLLRAAKQAVVQNGNWKEALTWAIADAEDT